MITLFEQIKKRKCIFGRLGLLNNYNTIRAGFLNLWHHQSNEEWCNTVLEITPVRDTRIGPHIYTHKVIHITFSPPPQRFYSFIDFHFKKLHAVELFPLLLMM